MEAPHHVEFDLNFEAPHVDFDLNMEPEEDENFAQGGFEMNLQQPVAADGNIMLSKVDNDVNLVFFYECL